MVQTAGSPRGTDPLSASTDRCLFKTSDINQHSVHLNVSLRLFASEHQKSSSTKMGHNYQLKRVRVAHPCAPLVVRVVITSCSTSFVLTGKEQPRLGLITVKL